MRPFRNPWRCEDARHANPTRVRTLLFGLALLSVSATPTKAFAQVVQVSFDHLACDYKWGNKLILETFSGHDFWVEWDHYGNPFPGDPKRGIFGPRWSGQKIVSNDGKYLLKDPTMAADCYSDVRRNVVTGETFYYSTFLNRVATADVVALKKPNPHFELSTNSQSSGDGGQLRISAGRSISLSAKTTDYGVEPASVADHEWFVDQLSIGSGASASYTPSAGSHDVWVTLGNLAGIVDVHATVDVVAPDEASSCDDPLTDVVESNCDSNNSAGEYSVASGSPGDANAGELWCLWDDHYVWSVSAHDYILAYSVKVACWMM